MLNNKKNSVVTRFVLSRLVVLATHLRASSRKLKEIKANTCNARLMCPVMKKVNGKDGKDQD